MMAATKKKKGNCFGLLGTATWDIIELTSGKRWSGPGGILYQAATLCGLGDDVLLISNIGEELWAKVSRIVSSWLGLKKDALNLVPGPGNQVYLYYPLQGERRERLKWAVPPLSSGLILPYLKELDFFLAVFNSGFDIDFYNWRQVVSSCTCPIWLDIHSLVLSSNFGLRKYQSFDSWPAWIEGVNYLQANEKEAACLLGCPERRLTPKDLNLLADKCFSLGVEALFITLGKKGVYVGSPEVKQLVTSEKSKKVVDTTGCGDCFAAATAWQLNWGKPPQEAARFGLYIASQAVGTRGIASTYRLISRLARKNFL